MCECNSNGSINTMYNRIPIDIVEIVIVKSDSYDLYQTLKGAITKLNDIKRESRINDKLTKVFILNESITYRLNSKLHREYDKPCFVSYIAFDDDSYNYCYEFRKWSLYNRNNGFYRVDVLYRDNEDVFDGTGIKDKNIIDMKELDGSYNNFYLIESWIDKNF